MGKHGGTGLERLLVELDCRCFLRGKKGTYLPWSSPRLPQAFVSPACPHRVWSLPPFLCTWIIGLLEHVLQEADLMTSEPPTSPWCEDLGFSFYGFRCSLVSDFMTRLGLMFSLCVSFWILSMVRVSLLLKQFLLKHGIEPSLSDLVDGRWMKITVALW